GRSPGWPAPDVPGHRAWTGAWPIRGQAARVPSAPLRFAPPRGDSTAARPGANPPAAPTGHWATVDCVGEQNTLRSRWLRPSVDNRRPRSGILEWSTQPVDYLNQDYLD